MRAFLLLQTLLPAAAAGSPPSLAVVAVDECRSRGAEAPAARIREALLRAGAVHVQSWEETVRPLGGLPTKSHDELKATLDTARAAFFDDDVRGALTLLAPVWEELARLPPSAERWALAGEAAPMLGWAHLRAGNRPAAVDLASRLLRVEPSFELDSVSYPPSVRSAFEQARAALAAQPGASLTVLTEPSAKRVFVEGRPVGFSPVTVEVKPGRYRVEADFGAPGIPAFISVSGARTLVLSEALEGAVDRGGGPCLQTRGTRQARLSAMGRLAARLEVEALVGVWHLARSPSERFLVATLAEAHTGQELKEGRVRLRAGAPGAEAIERLARFIATGELLPPVESDAPAPAPPSREEGGSRGRGGRRKLFASAAAVMGMAAAVGAATTWRAADSASGRLSSLRQGGAYLVGSEGEYRSWVSRQRGLQTASAALVATALASWAAGVLLSSWPEGSSRKVDSPIELGVAVPAPGA